VRGFGGLDHVARNLLDFADGPGPGGTSLAFSRLFVEFVELRPSVVHHITLDQIIVFSRVANFTAWFAVFLILAVITRQSFSPSGRSSNSRLHRANRCFTVSREPSFLARGSRR
jgi:hypothetical protein